MEARDAGARRRAELLALAKAKKRAKEEQDRLLRATGSGSALEPPPSSPAELTALSQAAAVGSLERELGAKCEEVAKWRQTAVALRGEQRALNGECERLGRANEQLHGELERRTVDSRAVEQALAGQEREGRRADKLRRLADERLENLRLAERRAMAADAAAVQSRREAAASAAAAEAANERVSMVHRASQPHTKHRTRDMFCVSAGPSPKGG
jgi:hypothetical protein